MVLALNGAVIVDYYELGIETVQIKWFYSVRSTFKGAKLYVVNELREQRWRYVDVKIFV